MVKQKKKKNPSKAKQVSKKTQKKKAPQRKSAPKAVKKSTRETTAKKKPAKNLKARPAAKLPRPAAQKPAAIQISAPVSAPEPQPIPVEPPPPARAPVRKIIGTDRTITIVPRPAERPVEQTQEREIPVPQLPSLSTELKLAEAPALALAPAPEPTYDWNSVPDYVPAEVRFSIKNAIKECEAASAWPLPLAKFFASLPAEICGLQFAMMLMNLSQSAEEIAQVCGKPVERILSLLDVAQSNLQEKFSTKCGEIYRRWRLQLSGRGADSAELIAHHSISQVDRDWQVTVANIILKAMGGEHFANGGTPHPNRWWLNPAHAQQAGS